MRRIRADEHRLDPPAHGFGGVRAGEVFVARIHAPIQADPRQGLDRHEHQDLGVAVVAAEDAVHRDRAVEVSLGVQDRNFDVVSFGQHFLDIGEGFDRDRLEIRPQSGVCGRPVTPNPADKQRRQRAARFDGLTYGGVRGFECSPSGLEALPGRASCHARCAGSTPPRPRPRKPHLARRGPTPRVAGLVRLSPAWPGCCGMDTSRSRPWTGRAVARPHARHARTTRRHRGRSRWRR